MSFAYEIVCPRCDKRFGLSLLLNLCPCGSPLLVRYNLERPENFRQVFAPPSNCFAVALPQLLPLQDDANLVSLGEGWTPLLHAKKLGTELGFGNFGSKTKGKIRPAPSKTAAFAGNFRAKNWRKKAAIPSAGNAGGSFAAMRARRHRSSHLHAARYTSGQSNRSRAVRRQSHLGRRPDQ